MIYLYGCDGCNEEFDIIKPVAEMDAVENCPTSGTIMVRLVKPKIHLHNTGVQDKVWQPALGRAASTSELRNVAKEKGWVEVGNEKVADHVTPYSKPYEI